MQVAIGAAERPIRRMFIKRTKLNLVDAANALRCGVKQRGTRSDMRLLIDRQCAEPLMVMDWGNGCDWRSNYSVKRQRVA